jgi:hypothetical protein
MAHVDARDSSGHPWLAHNRLPNVARASNLLQIKMLGYYAVMTFKGMRPWAGWSCIWMRRLNYHVRLCVAVLKLKPLVLLSFCSSLAISGRL